MRKFARLVTVASFAVLVSFAGTRADAALKSSGFAAITSQSGLEKPATNESPAKVDSAEPELSPAVNFSAGQMLGSDPGLASAIDSALESSGSGGASGSGSAGGASSGGSSAGTGGGGALSGSPGGKTTDELSDNLSGGGGPTYGNNTNGPSTPETPIGSSVSELTGSSPGSSGGGSPVMSSQAPDLDSGSDPFASAPEYAPLVQSSYSGRSAPVAAEGGMPEPASVLVWSVLGACVGIASLRRARQAA